jgi:hypothetical protein
MGLFDFFNKKEEEVEKSDALEKALPKGMEPQSFDFNPYDHMNTGFLSEEIGSLYHPGASGGLEYQTLRRMSRVPSIAAIMNTRVNQVAEFSSPQATPFSLGYTIRLRDRQKEPSEAQQKKIQEMTDWLSTCGDPRLGFTNTFEAFLRKVVRDSLTLDQACFEVVRTRGNKIAGFVPVDATTIRRARPTQKEKDKGRRDPDNTAFVQIVKDRIVAKFTEKELCFGIRRPRTNINANGYGYPELEELIKVVTNIIHAEVFNSNNFTNGMHASGILAIKSKMNPQLFRAFRREFYSMLSNVGNAHRTPIVQLDPENKEDISSINLTNTNREMQFGDWMSYNLRLACAIFSMDPAELGYQYGNENQSSSLASEGVGTKITASRERGLRPLLRAVESWINQWIVYEMEPSLEFAFQGFDQVSEDAKQKADIESLKAFRTINEVRAMYDLEPIDNEAADMVLDPAYMNMAFQIDQQGEEGQPEQGDEFGGVGEETEESEEFGEEEAEAVEKPEEESPESSPEEFSRSLYATHSPDSCSVLGCIICAEEDAPNFPILSTPTVRSVVVEVE